MCMCIGNSKLKQKKSFALNIGQNNYKQEKSFPFQRNYKSEFRTDIKISLFYIRNKSI